VTTRWDEIHTLRDTTDHAVRIHNATAGDLADTGDEPPELEQLRWAKWVRAEAAQLVDAAVVEARAAGASWTTVGAALGITRQSAWERYGALERERTWHLSPENPCLGCGASEDSYCDCPGGPAAF
jgi:hypothetical protein